MVSVAANMEGRGIAALTGTIVGYEIVEDHVEYIIELQCELIPTQDYSDEEIDTDYVEGNGSSFGDSANDFVCGAVQEEPQCIRWCISRRYNAFRRFTLMSWSNTHANTRLSGCSNGWDQNVCSNYRFRNCCHQKRCNISSNFDVPPRRHLIQEQTDLIILTTALATKKRQGYWGSTSD